MVWLQFVSSSYMSIWDELIKKRSDNTIHIKTQESSKQDRVRRV